MQLLWVIAMGASLASGLSAQSSYGRLTGRVIDPQGAAIAAAAVALSQVDTNIAVNGVTNAEGLYDFPSLLPGGYQMSVTLDGFKKYTRTGIIVRVGDILNVDVTLELGAVTESVSVTGEAPLLETTSASAGAVIDNKQLSDLPLAGRGVSFLMTLSPGVISTNAPMHGWLPQARGSVSDLAVSGTRTRSSEFTLDGIPNMEESGTIAFQPPPEMIQEFRVQTAAYDSSIGRFTGANVNMVLKSGANDYHGSGWFSHLSRPLMTHPFFVNRNLYDTISGPPTPEKRSRLWPATKTNRWRAQLGGPVRIPKLYNGKNKTFFSYGNDYMTRTFANLNTATVPTADQRRGDLSALLRIGAQYQIYDPATIAAAPNGRFSRQPLTGNIIPTSRLSPMAQKILDYYPLPNASGTVDGRNNFFSTATSIIDYWAHMARVDHSINDRHRFYVSTSFMRTDGDQGRNLVNDAIGNISVNKYTGAAFDYVWMVRSDLVVNMRYGLTRMRADGWSPTTGLDLKTLGFPASFTQLLDSTYTALPEITPEGYAAIGTNLVSRSAFTTHYWSGSVAKTLGSHALRFGGEHRVMLDNNTSLGNYSGNFTFGTIFTRGPLDNSPASPVGQGLAAFLLGQPTDGFLDLNAALAEKSSYSGLYLQNDWKATRKLTFNLGLRYETEGPNTERYNRSNRGFDFITVNPANAAARAAYAQNPLPEVPASAFTLNGGLLFSGVNGVSRALWDRNHNFASRAGLAWQLGTRMVVRAGYGLFFETLGADKSDSGQLGFNQRTRFNPSNDNGVNFTSTLANPFPNGLLAAPGASGGLTTYLGLAPGFFYPQRRTGYVQRWTFTIQRQLGANWLVEAGYTGNRGTRLGSPVEYNAVPGQYLSTSPTRDNDTNAALSRNVANPFRGITLFESSPAFLSNANVARSQLLRPYPHFTGISSTTHQGYSWYHAGHLRLERRFRAGYSLSGHYTWSKFMEGVDRLNVQDLFTHRAISPQDRPHHIAISSQYDFPFGKGRRWMAQAPRALDAALGGWSLNAIYQWQSGPPIGFGNVILYGQLGDIVLPYADRTVERWFKTELFERRASEQLVSNLRTFPLRLTGLRADGWNTWELGLTKDFRFTEKVKLQLRGEAVDAFNHAMFAAPNNGPVNTAFGQVTATIWTEQRKVTVAAKLYW
ncbi:MAG: carboxypeptidase regulatory-like domain-containing protein [Acidobacteria bacterium]|nr:carboxypeptidase regulatory-like domain-containing protein [Acidobacteriota bacterium]